MIVSLLLILFFYLKWFLLYYNNQTFIFKVIALTAIANKAAFIYFLFIYLFLSVVNFVIH